MKTACPRCGRYTLTTTQESPHGAMTRCGSCNYEQWHSTYSNSK